MLLLSLETNQHKEGDTIQKICSRCGKLIAHSATCSCRKYSTYNRKNDEEKRRFYSSYKWQKLRSRTLKQQPYCQRCWHAHKLITTTQLEGHHMLSYRDYPTERLNPLNIAILCKQCNMAIGDKSLVDWAVSSEVHDYLLSHGATLSVSDSDSF